MFSNHPTLGGGSGVELVGQVAGILFARNEMFTAAQTCHLFQPSIQRGSELGKVSKVSSSKKGYFLLGMA